MLVLGECLADYLTFLILDLISKEQNLTAFEILYHIVLLLYESMVVPYTT